MIPVTSALRAGVSIRVIRADGEVIDFGEAVDGDPRSQEEQRKKIERYELRCAMEKGS